MNWTRDDERRFNEMLVRRETVQRARRTSLMAALDGSGLPDSTVVEFADFLIQKADQVRDALEPYDSGIRLQISGGGGQ